MCHDPVSFGMALIHSMLAAEKADRHCFNQAPLASLFLCWHAHATWHNYTITR
jgi:hypothetical protein